MKDFRERESQHRSAFDDERGFAIHDTCWYVSEVRAERGCPPPAPLRGLFRSLFMIRGARRPRMCFWFAGPGAHERYRGVRTLGAMVGPEPTRCF